MDKKFVQPMHQKIKVISVVGARPNFMKVAPLHKAFSKDSFFESLIVHTGQHYDERMSDIFFNQLELPSPDYYLGVGSGSHSYVTAHVMLSFEQVVLKEKPNLIVVVGDVTSTLACALVATKMNIPLAHVEAGLRSGDRKMPEELNRIVTDSLSDLLFVTEQSGIINLTKEGVTAEKIFFVGNIMMDSLAYYKIKAEKLDLSLKDDTLSQKEYVLMTMHRPSNVDNQEGLKKILQITRDITTYYPVIFPMHPRTLKHLQKFELLEAFQAIPHLKIIEPQGYLQFIKLMNEATLVVTDSGGVQGETTYLQVPCITFRETTEQPVTIELGTNQLLTTLNPTVLKAKVVDIVNGKRKIGQIPPLWDGKTADRIVTILKAQFTSTESQSTNE